MSLKWYTCPVAGGTSGTPFQQARSQVLTSWLPAEPVNPNHLASRKQTLRSTPPAPNWAVTSKHDTPPKSTTRPPPDFGSEVKPHTLYIVQYTTVVVCPASPSLPGPGHRNPRRRDRPFEDTWFAMRSHAHSSSFGASMKRRKPCVSSPKLYWSIMGSPVVMFKLHCLQSVVARVKRFK